MTSAIQTPRLRRRDSLQLRLPGLIAGLNLISLAAFLTLGYFLLERTLVQAGSGRAQAAADQVASLFAQSAQQRLADVRSAAAADAIQRFLEAPGGDRRAAAAARLTSLVSAGQPPAEVWDAHATRVLEVLPPAAANSGAPALPAAAPSAAGLSPLQVAGETVFFEAVGDVAARSSAVEPAGAPPRRLGSVRIRRTMTATSDAISRLVGQGAVVLIGNQTGDVWSDLTKPVAGRQRELGAPGIHHFRSHGGERRVAAVSLIRSTPWVVAVEFPQSALVGPAWTFVTRMLLVGLAVAVAAAIAARVLAGRITTPLAELTRAAEAIAGGDYSKAVATGSRRDEIGRLGSAFKSMAERVEDAQRELTQRAQQRLTEATSARQDLDRFFSLSLDLLCIAGMDGYFTRVNPAWEEVLGWTAEELTSRPYQEFVHPDDRLATGTEATRLADGGTVLAFENRYRHRDGTYRWLQWKAVPLVDQQVIFAAARDVTDQKRAEQNLQEHADALASANRELEAFSYSVSHDLRAPLRHVTGFASLLEQRAGQHLDDQARRYLHTMKESANHLGRLIDDLLAFSRMGRTPLAKQPVDLVRLIDDVKREVLHDVNGREITWTVAPLPTVDADPAMLRQAFVNLLSNAVKYTRTRAHAHIEVGHHGNGGSETVVFVRDNGVGFEMQYAHKLFAVFQRLHRAEEFEGTGIGLANVKRIVHRHGGRIWAEGEPGRGATFYIALPHDDAPVPRHA